jgi:hypothetical protein
MKKFKLGRVLITPAALEFLKGKGLNPSDFLKKHQNGNWGQLSSEDWQLNEDALESGERLFSSYKVDDSKFWIITEWDRSATTVLLPSDY